MDGKVVNHHFFGFLPGILLVIISFTLHAQVVKTDEQLLKENDNNIQENNKLNYSKYNNTQPIEYKKNSFISKYNPVSLIFTGTMWTYQHVVSPQLFRHCIYEISCSNYSKLAIHQFGLVKGVFLSADRLMRCNTIAKDEIPPWEFDKNGLAIDEPIKYDTH